VVATILIIVAIAIRNLLRARISANEAAAASSVRTTNATQLTYQSAYNGYANCIAALGPPASTGCPASGPVAANVCLIDFGLASARVSAPAKTGYYFGMGVPAGSPPNQGYTVGGAAAGFKPNRLGGFCSNEDGVIRVASAWNAAPATVNATCLKALYSHLQ
jgi:hypothetical protein